jgi:oxygen-independent coproporphyrinogen-3 oxidase
MDTTNLLTLIEKYHGSGPRYTSYPTALQFSENVRALEYEQAIEASKLLGTKDIGLYFHLPFCDTLCYFCGCTMMISNNRDRIAEYVGYLKKEIDLVSSRIRDNSNVVQIHWGGGSPTHLTPAEIEELGLYIREKFVVDPDVEMSIEVDPRGFTEAHAIALEHAGFNRASVGVQDFDPDVQVAVNRVQSFEMTREVIRLLRKH